MTVFKKNDLILSLAIGIFSALMIIFVGRNLSGENAFLVKAISYDGYLLVFFPLLCIAWIFATRFATKFFGTSVHQLGKFVLTGGFNFLLDATVLNFFIFSTGVTTGIYQSGFKCISFAFGVIGSYLLNKHWTFSDGMMRKSTGKEVYQFITVSIVGFAINVGADYIFVNAVGVFWDMKPALWAQFSAVLASAIAMIWNFAGYKFFVFNKK